MGYHDTYGKSVLRRAAGSSFIDRGPATFIAYGERGGARIDGVIGQNIAVEVEARVSKQVRGALLDLIFHPYQKKLLLLLPANMDADLCADQCTYVLARFLQKPHFRVVVLAGSGHMDAIEQDAEKVRCAISELHSS